MPSAALSSRESSIANSPPVAELSAGRDAANGAAPNIRKLQGRSGTMGGRLDGKVALVTGGGTGIGAAICIRLAGEGSTVAILDIDFGQASQLADAIRIKGGKAQAFQADVTDAAQTDAAVAACVEAFGGLDIAVNNAAVNVEHAPIAEFPPEGWRRVIDVNLTGVFHCMRSEIPHLVARGGGSIVNVSSIMGTLAMPTISAYVAAKHGVVGLTKAGALEYGHSGVRVNAVGPSFIKTALTRGLSDDQWAAIAAGHALGRCAEPDDIAAVVVFLASLDAQFMTGQLYLIDGGYSIA
ncbi:NAD(P)-dependent dehydrogenase (short-subunit alcohol dehydrogenase family) [Azospirillum fermentarium]|uniref:SDR family NAD(P)-dependent oxidoreductase n=1 Tax=Azospirillum fermentarium TaxID=1233114 RepID=UPI002225E6B7|nr:SDR family NAD(P)-dependent oxidoreductase [Azospirillum fermentarium]MCW2249273.1 NAD(P)-dependent dehydrogenase (short-subunit alcohol dehydrogenase family) [Azospirillum fermentarium]